MIVICVTLLLLHQGHTLIPVTTAQLGEPAAFTCFLPNYESKPRQFHWYKQSVGDSLKLIVAQRKGINPVYGPGFSASRLDLNIHKNISNLTILSTIQEDEGMYHCALVDFAKITWSGTYLSLTGNPLRTSNYTVVQWPTVSDPVGPGDSMTLQCSVLSDSDNKTCPVDHSVFWFRAGSNKSHPNIIYTDGNRHKECDKRSDTQKSCVYRFTKNVSSSHAGTYYCAVATCGEILFGNGTKVVIEGTRTWSQNAVVFLLCAVLVTSLMVLAFLIYAIKCDNAAVPLQKIRGGQKSQQRNEHMQVYSAVVFTMMKTDRRAIRDAKAAEREGIYTAVKAFGGINE